jgi:hypothetical protein
VTYIQLSAYIQTFCWLALIVCAAVIGAAIGGAEADRRSIRDLQQRQDVLTSKLHVDPP